MSIGRVIVDIPFGQYKVGKTKSPGICIPGLSISTRCQESWLVRFSYTVTESAGTLRVLIQQQAHGQQQSCGHGTQILASPVSGSQFASRLAESRARSRR